MAAVQVVAAAVVQVVVRDAEAPQVHAEVPVPFHPFQNWHPGSTRTHRPLVLLRLKVPAQSLEAELPQLVEDVAEVKLKAPAAVQAVAAAAALLRPHRPMSNPVFPSPELQAREPF